MTEYETMINALKATGLPFAEDGWDEKPAPPYGVYAIDGGAGALWAGDHRQEHASQGTVDLYTPTGKGRIKKSVIENALDEAGVSYYYNSEQYERDTRLMHYEWVFTVDDGDADDGED